MLGRDGGIISWLILMAMGVLQQGIRMPYSRR
jgi:hypothetical protein